MIGFARQEMSRGLCLRRKFGVKETGQCDWLEPAGAFARELADSIRPGEIILITGASGSGKSLLMGQLQQSLQSRACVVGNGELPDVPVIDALHFVELEQALSILCRFGLGEVNSYLAPVRLLSAGQQFRLRLAMGYAQLQRRAQVRLRGRVFSRPAGRACPQDAIAHHVLVVDEFATCLDRYGAAIIARNFRRAIGQDGGIAAIVASCRDDLRKAMRPDRVVRCDFGEYALAK